MFKQTLTALLFAATLYAPHALAADAPPFVPTTITTGNDFAANTVWYTFQNGQKGFFLSNPEGEDFIALNRSRIREVSDKYLWCFVGNNTDGYRIYNKAAGAGKVLAAPSVTGDGGNSFAVLKDANQLDGYTALWILSSSKDLEGKAAFYLNVKGNDSWKLNNRDAKLAFWTGGADHGSSFVVNTVKEAGEGGEVTVSPSTGALTSSNPSSSYKKLWSSNSAVPLTLDAGANNMNVVNDILQLHAGSAKRCNYVFSVPVGYAVKSIEFDFQLGKATDKEVIIEGYGQRFKVSGDVQHFSAKIAGTENAATILLSGENVPVKFMNAKVVVERVNVIPESQVNVFDYKADTREGYRIPAIAVTGKSGAIVAFSDARYTPGASDIGYGRVDLVVSRSEDNGKTWSTPEVMKDAQGHPVAQGDGIKNSDLNKSRTAGYGDAAVVADRESDDVLVLSVSGYTVFFNARRETPNAVARWISHDGGKTFSQHEDITDHIYKQFDGTTPRGKIESMFFGSGRITQSRFTKVEGAKYYRIYAVLSGLNVNPQNIANWVMYSDDFGKNWKILGDAMTPAIPYGADEPKCEELPDGSIVVSSRRSNGRWFNVFRFTDSAKGEGYWEEMAHSPLVKASDNACNGELLIVPVVKKATNKKMYLALQSIPFGPGRTNVGINYKELADASDFSSSANFAKQWDGAHKASQYGSAYSVMAWQKNNTLAFMYEEDPEVAHPGYTLVYKNYTIEQITDGAYSYAADDDMTVANELTKAVLEARVAEAKQHVGTAVGQYPAEVGAMLERMAEYYKQTPSYPLYEVFNAALQQAPVNEVTDKYFFYLQNDGYKNKEQKSYYLQFDENQKPKGVDAYDDTDEKQYFVFYNVPKKPGHYYIYNKSWDRFLLPLQNDNQAVLVTENKDKAGEYVLEYLGNGETLIRCVNAKNPAHPYLHLAGDKQLVGWEGKSSAPSHWRILSVGLETNMTTAVKSAAAKSATPVQYYDLSGRKVSQAHKGLKVSKEGKAF